MEDDEEDLLHRADSFSGTFADAGTYSLIGAVAVLGGMASETPRHSLSTPFLFGSLFRES